MQAPYTAGSILLLAAAVSAAAEPSLRHVDVFRSGQDGYQMYRIPALATAPDGSLIAVAEARKYSGADPGYDGNDIDLVWKRSTDGGQTWSAQQIVEDPGERWSAANPATVVDRTTQRVWLLYLRSKPGRSTATSRPGTDDMQTLARWSDDHGMSWSAPIDLSAVARDYKDPEWKASVVGPGGAIQDRRGRLTAPVWKSPYQVFAIYSDDHGRSWQRTGFVPDADGCNESQLVELADGQILVDMRQGRGPHRWLSVSNDRGQTWSEPRAGKVTTPCACAIERFTLKSAGTGKNRILWTGPKGPGRNTLVVRISYDEGQTFATERIIAEQKAAYSDLTILNDRQVGVLWERGGYQFITLTTFDLEWLEPTD